MVNDMTDKKQKIYSSICLLYILVTGGINVFGYFKLPAEIATQFSFSGESVNRMPTPIYMIVSFGIVFLLSMFCMTKGQEQKLKYLLVNTILVVANIVMIVTQL